MRNLVNFTINLEMLQNRLDWKEENLNYSNKDFKFATDPISKKGKTCKKYFNLDEALDGLKKTKIRLIDIKRKREYRELLRASAIKGRNGMSMMDRQGGMSMMERKGGLSMMANSTSHAQERQNMSMMQLNRVKLQ